MKALLNRMIQILIRPRDERQVIRDEPAAYENVLLRSMTPLAALPLLNEKTGFFFDTDSRWLLMF